MSNLMKVLIVDDHESLLSGLRRQFRERYQVTTATSGPDAIEKLSSDEPFAVVISDMRMPEMDGVEFLEILERKSPDTVRMMLTGNADQETAVRAINSGHIFRFFNKPCDAETLSEGIDAGIQQYKVHQAEKVLIEKTLSGSVKLLADVLSLSNPHAAHRRVKMRAWGKKLAKVAAIPRGWELDLAVMLSDIGMIGIPAEVTEKATGKERLTSSEQELLRNIPQIGSDLIANIPRMENIARGILYQQKHYSGDGFPVDGVHGEEIPLIGRVLKILTDLVSATDEQVPDAEVFERMKDTDGVYDPKLLRFAEQAIMPTEIHKDPKEKVLPEIVEVKMVPVYLLRAGQELLSDICLMTGQMILARGCTLSEVQVQRLRGIHKTTPLKENIKVAYPVKG